LPDWESQENTVVRLRGIEVAGAVAGEMEAVLAKLCLDGGGPC
jgi:hypothetical protein